MFILGHLGFGVYFGKKIFSHLSSKKIFYLLSGSLLPDLIDKPLFFFLKNQWSWISGTRTFGHTFIFVFSLYLVGKIFKKENWKILSFACFLHIFFDHFIDIFNIDSDFSIYSNRIAGMFWPFLGNRFLIYDFKNIEEYLFSKVRILNYILEVFGLFLIYKEREDFKKITKFFLNSET